MNLKEIEKSIKDATINQMLAVLWWVVFHRKRAYELNGMLINGWHIRSAIRQIRNK